MLTPSLARLVLFVGVVATAVPAAQRDPESLRARLVDRRPLDASEVDQLLSVVRAGIGGRPFHFIAEQGGFAADVLFERDGHVRYIRRRTDEGVSFTEYTGRIARGCDGSIGAGEMVLEYRQTAGGWVVSGRASTPADSLRPVFDVLVGLKTLVDEGPTGDGARAFSVEWNQGVVSKASGGGGAGAGRSSFALDDPTVSGVERIFIDTMTLRPTAWEFTFGAPGQASSTAARARYRFEYEDAFVLMPPRPITNVPDCVENRN